MLVGGAAESFARRLDRRRPKVEHKRTVTSARLPENVSNPVAACSVLRRRFRVAGAFVSVLTKGHRQIEPRQRLWDNGVMEAGQAPPGDSGQAPAEGIGQLGDPGDLGRRVALRRQELGLTRSRSSRTRLVWHGATWSTWNRSPAEPSAGTVARLAAALKTTAADLLGAGRSLPVGRGQGGGVPPVLQVPWSGEECARLLAPGGVGRLVAVDARGSCRPSRQLRGHRRRHCVPGQIRPPRSPATDGLQVGFEVDRVDEAMPAKAGVCSSPERPDASRTRARLKDKAQRPSRRAGGLVASVTSTSA